MQKVLKPALAIGLGLLLAMVVLPAVVKWATESTAPPPTEVVANIRSVQGTVEAKVQGALTSILVKDGSDLHSGEVLTTHATSEAVLDFKGGTQLKLKESSRAVVVPDVSAQDGLIVTILEGGMENLNPAAVANSNVHVFQNGKPIGLAQLSTALVPVIRLGVEPAAVEPNAASVVTATVPVAKPSASATPVGTPPRELPGKNTVETITNDEIVTRFKAQTGFFQRCFLTHLERIAKNPNMREAKRSGTVTVSFTIQSTGRISGSKIVRSDFQDPILHNCVSEVVDRTAFRGFTGDAVTISEFPIQLE